MRTSLHRPSLSREQLSAIDQDADRVLARFKRKHSTAIALNPFQVKHRFVRRISEGFVLKRGPNPDPQIIEAHRMLREGVKRSELIPRLVDGFKTLDAYGQSLIRKSFYTKLKRYERSLRKNHKKQPQTRALESRNSSVQKITSQF